ncbi:MAG: DUF6544 family protein [Candidatus Izemoplasma sp.]|nr:DUF6544 family protein [Candidatus Izemoplasma sp.]
MSIVYKILLILVVTSLTTIVILSLLNTTKRRYHDLLNEGLEHQTQGSQKLITDEDLEHLPTLVKNYLNYVGVVGTPHVTNFQLELTGEMKMKQDGEFSPYKAEQTSFINQGIRLFYMDLWLNRMKVSGLHHYHNDDASMKIKFFDVFKVVDESGEIMQKAETVTFFNDMVVFAPQTLIRDNIQWETIDNSTVQAIFTHNQITISAELQFDDEGKLVNFISQDRLVLDDEGLQENVPWSTPISTYHTVGDLTLPKAGKGIWHYESGDFTYITLQVESITYNID